MLCVLFGGIINRAMIHFVFCFHMHVRVYGTEQVKVMTRSIFVKSASHHKCAFVVSLDDTQMTLQVSF